MPVEQPAINEIAQSLTEYGAVTVLLSFVILLLFIYFWKLINQKPKIDLRFDHQDSILDKLMSECQNLKEEIIKLNCLIRGSFRNKGWDDDDNN